MNTRTKACLALLLNALIWGAALPLIKKGYSEITPMTFLFYRYLTACIASIPLIIIYWKKVKCNLKDLPLLFAIGFFSTVIAHTILYIGLDKTSAVESSILTSLIPVFITAGAAIFLKEKITKTEKVGTSVALIGSLFIILVPFIQNHGQIKTNHSLGNFCILLYNFIWMLSVIWMKKVAKKFHPFTIAYSSFFISLIGFSFLAYYENQSFLNTNYFTKPEALTAIFYMGTLGSVAALFLYQYGQSKIEASEASVFTHLQTLFSVPLAAILLKEKITLPFIIGSCIIIIGIFIAEKRWHPQSRKAKTKT
jgi:drug/metabolite transporter (DMT)-like permease